MKPDGRVSRRRIDMKRSLAILAITSALIFPALAEDAPKSTDPVRTTPIENKLSADSAHMQGQMNGLLDARDSVQVKIDALQKKIDATNSTSEKLKK
jgi:peptidoglycan hydrolase CwlO-like protein